MGNSDPFTLTVLGALTTAVVALWKQVQTLTARESECRGKLDAMQRDLNEKHQQNLEFMALICRLEEPTCTPKQPAP